MSDLTLEQQARRESGLGLEYQTPVTVTALNGSPNDAADPAIVGASCEGKIWAIYAVRPNTGTPGYRLWVRWKGQISWDAVEGSDKTASRNVTNRPRIAGADRFYVEITAMGGATSIDLLYGVSTGVYAAPVS